MSPRAWFHALVLSVVIWAAIVGWLASNGWLLLFAWLTFLVWLFGVQVWPSWLHRWRRGRPGRWVR